MLRCFAFTPISSDSAMEFAFAFAFSIAFLARIFLRAVASATCSNHEGGASVRTREQHTPS